jgi:hypothetical protein
MDLISLKRGGEQAVGGIAPALGLTTAPDVGEEALRSQRIRPGT